MANRTSRTSEKDELFFQALATGKTVSDACRKAGYARRSVYEWKADDEEFATRWREAEERALELMEKEADRRALKGVLKPIFQGGEKVGQVRVYSDTLLIFRLKAIAPEKYRERVDSTVTLNRSHEDALAELE